jgi:hypothetical protein
MIMDARKESLEERWQRLRERTSVAGWKGLRSVAVAAATWDAAHELARVVRVDTHGAATPSFVTASESGSVFLSWGREPGPVMTVELTPEGSFEWEVDGPDGFASGEEDRTTIVKRIAAELSAANA